MRTNRSVIRVLYNRYRTDVYADSYEVRGFRRYALSRSSSSLSFAVSSNFVSFVTFRILPSLHWENGAVSERFVKNTRKRSTITREVDDSRRSLFRVRNIRITRAFVSSLSTIQIRRAPIEIFVRLVYVHKYVRSSRRFRQFRQFRRNVRNFYISYNF